MRALVIAIIALTVGCKKADKPADTKPKEAPASAGTVENGVRRISVEANNEGYTPARIAGKPGEKLVLVFKRTADSSCIAQLKAPDGKMVDLPLNQTVDVPVTVPATGELGFACGMDMFHGVVVADPKS